MGSRSSQDVGNSWNSTVVTEEVHHG